MEKDDFDENAGSDETGYGADTAFADAGPLIEEANNAEDIGGMSTDEEADYLAKSA